MSIRTRFPATLSRFRAGWPRMAAWTLVLAWTIGWGLAGFGPWLGVLRGPATGDSTFERLLPVTLGAVGMVAARRHPLAGGVFWLLFGFLLSSVILSTVQSVGDFLTWLLGAFPALLAGALFIASLTAQERDRLARRRK
jgi:hypothetical protein